MNTIHTEMDALYLVERTHDEDGSGWSFARLTLPADLIGRYVAARDLWDERTAHGFNNLIDIWNIPADIRVMVVNEGAFDRTVATLDDVKKAVMALQATMDAIVDYVTEHEVTTYGIRLDECDWTGEVEFKARYMPLILAADVMGERKANDMHSHANRLDTKNHTSLFNGR